MDKIPELFVETPDQLKMVENPDIARIFKTFTPAQRLAAGKALREKAPRKSHAGWAPSPDRRDPVVILEEQNQTRIPEYIPIRYGRMLASPFAFFRGSAAVMAQDLARTPVTGIYVQANGDAHLSNFGLFASQERNLMFGLNDFDESLPGPWEWDVKRLAASMVVAGQYIGLKPKDYAEAARASVWAYRMHMREYAQMGYLDLFYARINDQTILAAMTQETRAQAEKVILRARRRTHLQVLEKLTEVIDGSFRIVEAAPLIVRRTHTFDGRVLVDVVGDLIPAYRESLSEERRGLLDRYQMVDAVLKVVGVGSVGTRCWVTLFRGYDDHDPLFLQVKEAQASVLEEYLKPSIYPTHGQRVVEGQRLIQPAPDIFLGWYSYPDQEKGVRIDYYVRQLRDMKGSVSIEPGIWQADAFVHYGGLCGWALALAHARSGDPAMIAGYLGSSDRFDRSIVEFATIYSDQNERDYLSLVKAAQAGRIQSVTGL